jgi:hypothetical protein
VSRVRCVRVATTEPLDLSKAAATIDGVAVAEGDRVLVKNQRRARQNGLFEIDEQLVLRALNVTLTIEDAYFVAEGTMHGRTEWLLFDEELVDFCPRLPSDSPFVNAQGDGGSLAAIVRAVAALEQVIAAANVPMAARLGLPAGTYRVDSPAVLPRNLCIEDAAEEK